MAKKMRKATIRQKSPMASKRAKARMAQAKSCCFVGLANVEAPRHSPNSSPRASHPYHGSPSPTVTLAAASVSLEMAPVWKLQLKISEVRGHGAAQLLRLSSVRVSGSFSATADRDLLNS